jgi:hypothetical protein
MLCVLHGKVVFLCSGVGSTSDYQFYCNLGKIGQRMYNVTLWHICITTVAVEMQLGLNIMSVSVFLPWLLGMKNCIFYVSYIVICGLYGSTIFFPHYLINGTIFTKTLLNKDTCFYFLYNFCPKHFSFYEEFRKILQMCIGHCRRYLL